MSSKGKKSNKSRRMSRTPLIDLAVRYAGKLQDRAEEIRESVETSRTKQGRTQKKPTKNVMGILSKISTNTDTFQQDLPPEQRRPPSRRRDFPIRNAIADRIDRTVVERPRERIINRVDDEEISERKTTVKLTDQRDKRTLKNAHKRISINPP